MSKKSDNYDRVVQDEKDATIRETARMPARSDAGLRADPPLTPRSTVQSTDYVQPLKWWQKLNVWLGGQTKEK